MRSTIPFALLVRGVGSAQAVGPGIMWCALWAANEKQVHSGEAQIKSNGPRASNSATVTSRISLQIVGLKSGLMSTLMISAPACSKGIVAVFFPHHKSSIRGVDGQGWDALAASVFARASHSDTDLRITVWLPGSPTNHLSGPSYIIVMEE
jgi:hypothetical protein